MVIKGSSTVTETFVIFYRYRYDNGGETIALKAHCRCKIMVLKMILFLRNCGLGQKQKNQYHLHTSRVFSKNMHHFQLSLFNNHIQRIRIQINACRRLYIVIHQQTVRQFGAKLKRYFTTQSQLECLNCFTINLNKRVILCKHKCLLVSGLFKCQLGAALFKRERCC